MKKTQYKQPILTGIYRGMAILVVVAGGLMVVTAFKQNGALAVGAGVATLFVVALLLGIAQLIDYIGRASHDIGLIRENVCGGEAPEDVLPKLNLAPQEDAFEKWRREQELAGSDVT